MAVFQLVALTPSCLPEPALAVAACRAGELGAIDLEFVEPARASAALTRLAQLAGARFGVRLGGAALPDALPDGAQVFILAGGPALGPCIAKLHSSGRAAWVEITGADQIEPAIAAGADGLIARGHEAGGPCADETTFILLQRLLAQTALPVFAHGGIGLHSAGACRAAGAAGVILDLQLGLARESALPEAARQILAGFDGSSTVVLGDEFGASFRFYHRPGVAAFQGLPDSAASWRAAIGSRIGWEDPQRQLLPLGQDASCAEPLARRFVTVAGILAAVRAESERSVGIAARLQPLAEAGALAGAHGTRFPIVQGPMTRVSDRPAFARAVAEGGGLPFLALALMRGPEVARLLAETGEQLGERPWGVGLLGFVPHQLRQEQIAAVAQARPPFALIAGGRPDQARPLEKIGISTYLHVPSPGLLRLFLKDGARRFVFEGRECGGHIGPRGSLALWDSAVATLLDELPPDPAELSLLFAGGIHDGRSAAMVAALAAPLVERGAKIGVLMGTSYLFTPEAVGSGAIVPGFQAEALACKRTVLLETGPGHATRCADSPFYQIFVAARRELEASGTSTDELRSALEALNLGRLRIAAKGIAHNPAHDREPEAPRYLHLDDQAQHAEGMYMIGQLAALRGELRSIFDLHADVSAGSVVALQRAAGRLPVPAAAPAERPSDVAVIGMACLLPGATDLKVYWEHILGKVDSIVEIPPERWDWRRYYDHDRRARDKIYSRWGGFLDEVPFDPTHYGIPPTALRSIEPVQLLALETVRAALADAGYATRPFPRERTSVILGAGGGAGELGEHYAVRSSLPALLDPVPEALLDRLPEWSEDSFPGILLNVIAGRVANRFDLGGLNFTVDAACASSLAAIALAVRELEGGSSDLVIAGGVDNVQNPFGFMCFSKTRALSPRGRCRPFDDEADGIAISEGVAVVILKRLADAERDGDRIYAVIKGVGGSSDGRDRSLTAPRPEGQARALRRAYAKANVSPATIGLIEAHGTGTVVGDLAEIQTIQSVFVEAGAAPQSCAVGSVKSNIGHTKCAAGVAGLIKTSLALFHRVLPPTINVETPNRRAFGAPSPLYINTEARPWIAHAATHPRRAGVSAFGFGGTNFHAVLEEHTASLLVQPPVLQRWPAELCLWAAADRQALAAELGRLTTALAGGARPALVDLARALWWAFAATPGPARLAIVARDLDELGAQLEACHKALATGAALPSGAAFCEEPLAAAGDVAALFPGQGSQHPDMLRELTLFFPELSGAWELADATLAGEFDGSLSVRAFPPPAFSAEGRAASTAALTRTDIAQPALGAASVGLYRLLRRLGLRPQRLAGHSYGEYVALWAAGALGEDELYRISYIRGKSIIEAAEADLGTMAAVAADAANVRQAIGGVPEVWLANLNGPRQTVIAGSKEGIARATERLKAAGLDARPLAVACAFHSPLVAPAQGRLAAALAERSFQPPTIPVFANATAAPYPQEPQAIIAQLSAHLEAPVRFAEQVEALYAAGTRIFVEVGPKAVLSGLVSQNLAGRPHLAVAIDQPGHGGVAGMLRAIGQLAVNGVSLQLGPLFAGRASGPSELRQLLDASRPATLAATTWLVHGGGARPLSEPATLPPPPLSLAPAQEATRASEAEEEHGSPDRAVIIGFQGLMSHFLEAQRSVMAQFLSGAGAVSESGTPQPMPAEPREAAHSGAAAAVPEASVQPSAIARYRLRPTPRPAAPSRLHLAPGAVVITDDGGGVAQALAEALTAHGYAAPVLTGATLDAPAPHLEAIRRRHGAIVGLVHLAPLAEATTLAALPLAAWESRLEHETGSLFRLAQVLHDELNAAAAKGGAALLGVTAMGGAFGSADRSTFLPVQGAIAGLVKTIAQEWPTVLARAVDIEPGLQPATAAAQLLDELATPGGPAEVGYRAGARCVLELFPAPLGADDGPLAAVQNPVILATGGGRGITAEALLGLAAQLRPTLVLVGRTPLPVGVGAADAGAQNGSSDPAALRAALIAELRQRDEQVTPARVEREVRRAMAAQELQQKLTALVAAGARVDYRVADVADVAAFGALIEAVYRDYGRIDGVIHGAGVIEDKLLHDKDPAAFARVMAPKVRGALALVRHLRPETLRLLIFFSSVSGRFGNRGQADYAAANELLCKLARWLDARWEARIAAISWGPWRKGMVTPELERAFAARGVTLIDPEDGRRQFVDEVLRGRKGDAEIVIAGGQRALAADQTDGRTSQPEARLRQPIELPLLQGLVVAATASGLTLRYPLSLARDRYLDDHRIEGRPVLPFAMALELCAEVARKGWPELYVAAVRHMRVLQGIALDGAPTELLVTARAATDPPADRVGVDVDVTIQLPGAPRLSYRATVVLADRLPTPPAYSAPEPSLLAPFPLSVPQLYERWLFHGPTFAGIRGIAGIGADALVATVQGRAPGSCLAGAPGGEWEIDPVVFDSGLQLVIAWTRHTLDQTPLPAHFRAFHRFGALGPGPLTTHLRFSRTSHGPFPSVDIAFLDEAGRLRGLLEGMECPASPGLNRLAGVASS